ncbi:tyrosine-type recombinase/integrase [Guptibacillus hwajinpoensis]|uniref:tyrosine-type recombinase/integrase n=1 Tax=Guptibacillus hwajinpoensis TaxID=208199 RepID=UPI00384BD84C
MDDEKKLNSSIKKIYKVFEKMKHKSISVSGRKIADGTYDKTYPETIAKLLNEAYEQNGISDISQLNEGLFKEMIQKRVNDYHQNANTSQTSNINSILAAVKSFNLGIQETNVFKNDKKFSLGDTDEIREINKKQHIRRYASTSKTLRANPEQCEKVLENIANTGYKTETRELAYHISKISYLTGARVTAALNLKSRDIDIEANKITFFKDKGGLTRTIQVGEETATYLKSLQRGLQPHQNLFLYKRQDGTKKSVEEVRKAVEGVVSKAGKEFAVVDRVKIRDQDGKFKYVDVEKEFKVHSFRKGFCVNRTYEYLEKFSSKNALDDYIEQRIAQDPKIEGKLDNLYQRINKNLKKSRDIKVSEYAIFFTSVDIGHFRNDVIGQYYTTYQEVKDYFDNKK